MDRDKSPSIVGSVAVASAAFWAFVLILLWMAPPSISEWAIRAMVTAIVVIVIGGVLVVALVCSALIIGVVYGLVILKIPGRQPLEPEVEGVRDAFRRSLRNQGGRPVASQTPRPQGPLEEDR